MILIIDNYDSFTYNLYQEIGSLNADIKVIKNDALSVAEIEKLKPSHIIVSPGPGKPADSGVCPSVIRHFAGKTPILGVCLGHQAICEVFGGTVTYAKTLLHGKKSIIHIANGNPIFRGLAPVIEAARYHSLAAKRESIPDDLLVIAEDDAGEVMGVKHRLYDVYGVQFHPESILTPQGKIILQNFLNIQKEEK